jgi:hypothetical protein
MPQRPRVEACERTKCCAAVSRYLLARVSFRLDDLLLFGSLFRRCSIPTAATAALCHAGVAGPETTRQRWHDARAHHKGVGGQETTAGQPKQEHGPEGSHGSKRAD